jgi:Protein of unknown function (DUF2914)
MDDNKVVIKINFKPKRAIENKSGMQPPSTTEWNVKRIFIALFVFLFLIVSLVLWLTGVWEAEESRENIISTQKQVEKETNNIESNNIEKIDSVKVEQEKVEPEQLVTAQDIIEEKNIESSDENEVNETGGEQIKSLALTEQSVLPQHLVRALLAKAVINKEPVGVISTPITVGNDKAMAVYYFTELTAMQGRAVYHEWIFKGKPVFKRRIKVLGKRWRASTSKLISHQAAGDWMVRLTDDNGKVMNEIKFQVRGD